jgi:lipopolysaccharide export system permease protein
MPFLLYSYLTAEILGPFFASLLIINAILFLGKLSSLLDVIFRFGVDFSDFIRISIYLLPGLLLFSIPMTSTLGVIIAFTRLTGDNEILALKSSGISLYRLLVPVVMVAIFTAGLTALTSTILIPASSVYLKQTFYQLAKEKIDQGIREHDFSDNIKDVVIYVDRIDELTGRWQGVFISDQRDSKNPMTIIARSGSLASDLDKMTVKLKLADGSIHRNNSDSSQTITFGAYNLQLPINEGSPVTKTHKKDLSPAELLEKSTELRKKAENNPGQKEWLQRASNLLLIEFHKRLALPVGCLILTILALPLALQSRPGRRQLGLPLGLLFFFLYNILLSFAKSTAETSGLPIGPIIWLPNLIFAILTCLIIRTTARENSVRTLEVLAELISSGIDLSKKIAERFTK